MWVSKEFEAKEQKKQFFCLCFGMKKSIVGDEAFEGKWEALTSGTRMSQKWWHKGQNSWDTPKFWEEAEGNI